MNIQSIQNTLAERFAKPLPDFHKRRVIFWHDEEAEFADGIDELELSGVKLLKLTGSNWFYAKKLLCNDDTESNYLVYVPFPFAKPEDNWLRGLERQNEEFRADLVSMQMEELKIPQTISLRRAVKRYKKFFDSKERTTKLKTLGSIYTSAGQLHIDVLAVLCGTVENTLQGIVKSLLIALLYDENQEILTNICKFGSEEALEELLAQKLDYQQEISGNLESSIQLAGYIIISALALLLDAKSLSSLEQYMADLEQFRLTCYDIINKWLASDDCDKFYEIARLTEETYHISEVLDNLSLEQLVSIDILPCIDECIIKRFMTEISENIIKISDISNAVEKRRTIKWFNRFSDYYEGILQVAEMKRFIQENADGFHYAECQAMFNDYCNKLYLMDTYYRRFHSAFGRCLRNNNSELEDLFKTCAEYAEGLYKNSFLERIGDAWTMLAREEYEANGEISHIPKQSDFYQNKVQKAAENSRVFIIISDALRYEVAAEINTALIRETKGNAEITAMQGIFPSATKYGMAALLPHSELEITDDMKVLCDGMDTDRTSDREKILEIKSLGNTAITYKELLSMKKKDRRERIKDARVVYIYHNTIDAIGDKAITEHQVFDACNDTITEIKNIVRIITNDMNGTKIFITADHGFIYTYQKLRESDKLDKNIDTVDIIESNHRYLITKHKNSEYLLNIPMKKYGRNFNGCTSAGYI
ncbi:MAG: BREX-1 system phosphatase PglZ type A, partial [Oscillospiraceae bacterium]|nr:BREX-1 system phosphatase PglZ type A [Oscillospiraceae bacterium]